MSAARSQPYDFDKEILLKNLANISEAIPQLDFAGFSAYSVVVPEMLLAVKSALELPQPASVGIAWNMVDSIFQIIGGGIQIYTAVTGDTNKPIETGIEGGVNISTGGLVIGLTIASAALGSIGFAVACGVGSAIAIKNTIESARKSIDDDYWLEDSLEVLSLSNSKLAKVLTQRSIQYQSIREEIEAKTKEVMRAIEQQKADTLSSDTVDSIRTMIFHFMQNRIEETIEGIQKLQTDIFARLLTDYVEKGNQSYLITKEIDLSQFTSVQQTCLNNIRDGHHEWKQLQLKDNNKHRKHHVNNVLSAECEKYPEKLPIGLVNSYDTCKLIKKQSKEECMIDTKTKAIEAMFITLAFAGMVCLCIPGVQALAPFFIAPATAYFTAKYSVQIASAAQSIYSFFATNNEDKKRIEEPESKLLLLNI